MSGFIQLLKNEEEFDLFKERPTAFMLLALIASRAKRSSDHPNKELGVGEAYIGDWNVYAKGRQIYRTDLIFLEKHGKVTTRSTNRGTIVKIVASSPFDINIEDNSKNIDVVQPSTNHQLTTNNKYIIKKEKNSKTGFYPCTPQELQKIADELKVYVSDVKDVHDSILDKIADGTAGKYGKTTYYILRAWIRRGIRMGSIYKMTDSEMEDQMLLNKPIPPAIQAWFKELES